MVIRNGLFVPPNCPASRGRPIDILTARFKFFIHDCTEDRQSRRLTETEMFVLFGETDEHGESPNAVESHSLVVPINSDVATKAWRIAGDREAVEATEDKKVAKVRDALCDRVAHCHGVIKGECWAARRRRHSRGHQANLRIEPLQWPDHECGHQPATKVKNTRGRGYFLWLQSRPVPIPTLMPFLSPFSYLAYGYWTLSCIDYGDPA